MALDQAPMRVRGLLAPRVARAVGVGVVATTLLGAPPGTACVSGADACRCAQDSVAGYFERADEVVMARLVASEEHGTDVVLRLELVERPWKVADPEGEVLAPRDTVEYVTSASSAACGVAAEPDALYLVFGIRVDDASRLRVDTCSGTRAAGPEFADDRWGFVDTPARFVHRQLDALSGLDHLHELGEANLIGLLEIDAFAQGGAVPLLARPEPGAQGVANPASYDGLATREVGYEEPAAVVSDRVEGWFRLTTHTGATGWLRAADAGAWHPYETLPVAQLSYLTSAWSGHVWPEPGAGIPTRSDRKDAAGREEYPVNVLESAVVGGMVWFLVEVLDGDPCRGLEEPRPELTGWVPGYGVEGDPTVWYYSRGC